MIDSRSATEEDLRFVRDSWFESYRRGGYAPEIGFDLFSEGQRNLIQDLTRFQVQVAYAIKTPDEILSWVCYRNDVLHYAYTKAAYRHMGIATGLIEQCGPFKFYSHQTRAGINLAQKLGLRYNPMCLMKGNP